MNTYMPIKTLPVLTGVKYRKPKKKGRVLMAKKLTKKNVRGLAKRIQMSLGEKKYWMVETGGYINVSNAGSVISLSDVPNNITDLGRDGDQLTIRSLEINYTMYGSGAAPGCTRLIIFQWFLDTTPAIGDILLRISGSAEYVNAPYNHDKRFHFKILHDRTVGFNADGVVDKTHNYRTYILSFPRDRIQFQGASTTGVNKLYYLTVSDDGLTPFPTLSFMSKLNYSDS